MEVGPVSTNTVAVVGQAIEDACGGCAGRHQERRRRCSGAVAAERRHPHRGCRREKVRVASIVSERYLDRAGRAWPAGPSLGRNGQRLGEFRNACAARHCAVEEPVSSGKGSLRLLGEYAGMSILWRAEDVHVRLRPSGGCAPAACSRSCSRLTSCSAAHCGRWSMAGFARADRGIEAVGCHL